MSREDRRGGYLAAATGYLVGGVGSYLLGSALGPLDVSTRQFLTFDEKGELELEGVAIIMLLVVATFMGAIGCWLALRWNDHPRAALTGMLAFVLVGACLTWTSGRSSYGPQLSVLAIVAGAVLARAAVMAAGSAPPDPGDDGRGL